jgi:hypothetical protein
MKRNEKYVIAVPTILDAGEKKVEGRAGRAPPRWGKRVTRTLNGLLGHPQQSSLRPFPHKRGRKLRGLPLVTTEVALPRGDPPFRPVSDSCVGDFQ